MFRAMGILLAALTFGSAQAHPTLGHDGTEFTIVTLKLGKDKAALKQLRSQGYDIAGVNLKDGTFDVVLHDAADQAGLNSMGLEVLKSERIDTTLAPDPNYKTPDEIKTILHQYAEAYPSLARVESIGKSHENRDIWVLKISDNPGERELDEPAVLFNGMHHAREVMSPEVPLDIAEYLLTRYGSDPVVTDWVNDNEIWVMPMLNVDGNNKVWNGSSMWRKNVRGGYGVDINRNYSYAWGACNGSSGSTFAEDYRGPSAASEPETQAMMAFVSRVQPVFNISFHSYSEMVIYPYGCNGRRSETRDVVEPLGRAMAAAFKTDSGRGTYDPGTSWELLYSVDGGDIDWMYNVEHVIPYVIELNASGFQPPFSMRQSTVERARAAWMLMMERLSGSGVRGVVTDGSGRAQPNAMVTVASLNKDGTANLSWKVKNDGTYHIVLTPGMYRLTFELNGRTAQHDVTIGAERTDLDVQL
jgi:carboxypeptidase T